MKTTASFVTCVGLAGLLLPQGSAQAGEPVAVAPGVFFSEGDRSRGHCNNGWIEFEDHVLVVDANFPSGALELIPRLRAATAKPARFVFNTHHHGDHAYGNEIWAANGVTIIATTGALDEMRKVETGLFGDRPGRWEEAARNREDVRATKLRAPGLLFRDALILEDRGRRVELHWFGVAHTRGDGFAWLPDERILFTGDACVNGPYNNVRDGDIGAWIATLEKLLALDPLHVCPGHGPMGGPEIIAGQREFFVQLRRHAQTFRSAGRSAAEVRSAAETVRAEVMKNERAARWVGGGFAGQLEKAWIELGGDAFPR